MHAYTTKAIQQITLDINNLYSSTTQQTDTNRQTDKIGLQLTNTTNTKLVELLFCVLIGVFA